MQNPDLVEILESAKHLFSSIQQPLNDSSAEYIVSTTKHFFDSMIIVQYSI